MKQVLIIALLGILSFVANAQRTGDKIQILLNDAWYDGKIKQVDGDKYLVSYDDWSESRDEWVGKDRIKGDDELKNKFNNNDQNAIEHKTVGAGVSIQQEKSIDGDVDIETIYTSVSQLPNAPYNYNEYISQNIQYPKEALEKGIEGRVTVQFVVKKDGSISNVEVTKKVHPLLDAEAVRVIKSMPKWESAIQNGIKVNSYYMLPITFKLE